MAAAAAPSFEWTKDTGVRSSNFIGLRQELLPNVMIMATCYGGVLRTESCKIGELDTITLNTVIHEVLFANFF